MNPREYSTNDHPRRSNPYDPVHSASASWAPHPQTSPPYIWSSPPGLPQPWGHQTQQIPGPDPFQLAQNGGLPQPNPALYGPPPPPPPPGLEMSPGGYTQRQYNHPLHRLPGPAMGPPNHPGPDERALRNQAPGGRFAGFQPAAILRSPSSRQATVESNSLPSFAPSDFGANPLAQHSSSHLHFHSHSPNAIHPALPRHNHHHSHRHTHILSPGPARSVSVVDVPHTTRSPASSSGARRTTRTRRPMSTRNMDDEDELRSEISGRQPVVTVDQIDDDPTLRQLQLFRGSVTSKMVASKAALRSLMSIDISDLPENERTCIICYNEFGVKTPEGIIESPLRLPKCGHVFGEHCIKHWFEDSDSCPYCRDKVHAEPRIRGGSARALINMLRMRGLSVPNGATAEDVFLRVIEGGRLDISTRPQSDRRSPPFDTSGQSRRMRPRRNHPTSLGSFHPGIDTTTASDASQSNTSARASTPRVTMPPLRQAQSAGGVTLGQERSAPTGYSETPSFLEQQPLSPSATTFWPHGWAAPGEEFIVANPLHSNHTSSGESEGEL